MTTSPRKLLLLRRLGEREVVTGPVSRCGHVYYHPNSPLGTTQGSFSVPSSHVTSPLFRGGGLGIFSMMGSWQVFRGLVQPNCPCVLPNKYSIGNLSGVLDQKSPPPLGEGKDSFNLSADVLRMPWGRETCRCKGRWTKRPPFPSPVGKEQPPLTPKGRGRIRSFDFVCKHRM